MTEVTPPTIADIQEKPKVANITGPVTVWILLLFVALFMQFVVSSNIGLDSSTGLGGMLAGIASFILGTPGEITIPMVIGAVMGEDVGHKSISFKQAWRGGLLNGLYACLVYLIGIIVIYEVLTVAMPSSAPTAVSFVLTWIALPILICVAVTEIFAVASHIRKVGG